MTFITEKKHTTKMETNKVMKNKITFTTELTNTTLTETKRVLKNGMICISVMTYLMQEEIK